MNRTAFGLSLVSLFAGAVAGAAGCSSSSSNGTAAGDAGLEAGGGGFVLELPCTDTDDAIYADPGDVSAQPKGAVLKCVHDEDVSLAGLEARARATDTFNTLPYSGKPFTSGARIYRVLYRTERGDPNNTPSYSGALVYLPDTPRAAKAPVIVASHGTQGQGPNCAISKDTPQEGYVEANFLHQVLPLVGMGYAVIAPDLAGYTNYGRPGNPPSLYAGAQDVGKSTLDGARALRKLIPSSVTDQVVLVGHSQGGHTTLSALSMAESYGADGTVAAVAVYAPLWWSQRTWGAIFLAPMMFPFATSLAGPVSIWYHYTHAELLDGPGHGGDVFLASKRDAIKAFVDTDCTAAMYADLNLLGQAANDVFDPAYINLIKNAVLTNDCTGDATCQKWLDRMTADYPHLSGAALDVPILLLYAANDKTITPDLTACVFDRLTNDKANYTVCYDSNPVGHSGIVSEKSDYVSDWIAAKTLGAPAPAACNNLAPTGGEARVPDDAGAPVPCNPYVPHM
jgi:pimeloyl-ACP methyl ester carboxylesterase